MYPLGNCISASPETPYLQIGESKYGKPILDRIVRPETALEDAARCALVSLDSTIRSNLSVGLPIDLALIRAGDLRISQQMRLGGRHAVVRGYPRELVAQTRTRRAYAAAFSVGSRPAGRGRRRGVAAVAAAPRTGAARSRRPVGAAVRKEGRDRDRPCPRTPIPLPPGGPSKCC